MARRPAGPADAGTLYVVATPIGNLGDMSERAVETLRAADLILAEDTRPTRVLLDHFGVRKRPQAAHQHNEARMIPVVLDRLARGERIALVSDAGTPLVSDPGSRLVRAVRDAGFRVSPVPGASALTAALSAAGLDTRQFTFWGFLPRSGRERRETIAEISSAPRTSVLYEAAPRVSTTLQELANAGNAGRRCVVARELTKLYEEFREGTVAELAAYYADTAPRGEVVILLAAVEPAMMSEEDLRKRVTALRNAGHSARDIATALTAELGVPRNAVYRLALET